MISPFDALRATCEAGPPHPDTYKVWFKRTLWECHGGLCGICGAPVALEDSQIDHKTARSVGGGDEWENLQPAHKVCNAIKGPGSGAIRSMMRVRGRKYASDEERKLAHRIAARESARRKAAARQGQ